MAQAGQGLFNPHWHGPAVYESCQHRLMTISRCEDAVPALVRAVMADIIPTLLPFTRKYVLAAWYIPATLSWARQRTSSGQ